MYAKDYIPQIITFYDVNGREASDRKDITHALIKRTGELIPIKTIFSDEYYYGDFTKMNTYLMKHFSLSTDVYYDTKNPGISEVNYSDIQKIQNQLNGYLDVSEDAIKELKVFDIDDLLQFLEQTVEQFIHNIKKITA